MVTGENLTFSLTGGGPWGFRLQGGDNQPIRVSKIRKKSKAHASGVEEGDTVVSINGTPVSDKTHQGAMDLVDSAEETLTLQIIRGSNSQPLQEPKQLPQNAVIGQKQHSSDSTSVKSVTSSFTEKEGNTTRNVYKEESSEITDGRRTESVVQRETISSFVTDYEPDTPVSSLTYQETAQPFMPPVSEISTTQDTSEKMEETMTESKENIAPTEPTVSKAAPVFNVRNFKNQELEGQSVKPVFGQKQFPEPEKKEKSPNIPSFRVKNVKDGALYKEKRAPPPVAAKPKKPMKLLIGENIPQFNIKNVGNKPGSSWQPQSVTVTASTKPSQRFLPSMEDHQQRVYKPGYEQNKNYVPDGPGDNVVHHPDHIPVFGPPVEIHLGGETPNDDEHYDSEPGTPDTTSTGWSKRKLYADSAFYDDHDESYPTIGEQIKLCKIIASSLTSAINKRAKGARMFAKRKKKSAKWIHEGQSGFSSEKSSSAGDVADLYDLESELSPTDGGTKPLFSFRIPTVALRVAPPDAPRGKMTLSQDEFENLRLTKTKCDHHGVSPNTCFSLVEDLQSSKGRGSRMFQKRLAKSEKWVVDESNVKTPPGMKERTKLDNLLQGARLSPWSPNDDSFRHLNDEDRMRKVKDSLESKYNKASPNQKPAPVTKTDDFYMDPAIRHKLDSQYELKILEGENFNRTARGWGHQQPASQKQPMADSVSTKYVPPEPETVQPPPPPLKPVVQRDYNPRLKGWGNSQPDVISRQENGIIPNTNSMAYQQHPGYYRDTYGEFNAPTSRYQAQSQAVLPGCDL